MQTLFLASDHAGYALKNDLHDRLVSAFARGYLVPVWSGDSLLVEDLGPRDESSVDYPDYADRLVARMAPNAAEWTTPPLGLLICGSGQGMAMRANRQPWIRAALCWNTEVAKLSREHNNANVLCMGGRLLSGDEAWEILQMFLKTEFAGGRHQQRVDKLALPLVPSKQ